MLEDRYGLELTTSSTPARDAYVDAIDRMLSARGQVEDRLRSAIEADPDFALAHAALARQHQLMGRVRDARDVIETASGLAAGVSERERRHVQIYHHLINGKMPQSLELTREHIAECPRDAFALAPACGVFGSIGFSGRADREPEQLALLEPLAPHYGDDWWYLTVLAFALLETGDWARGRTLAERSLEQRPENPHGAHTFVHALFEAGADVEATRYLADWLPGADPDSLLHCHNWWHYALLLMATGDYDAAWEALRGHCLPGSSNSPSINVFTDSAAFLWRAELAGHPRQSEAWAALRDYYEREFHRPIVFVDAHAGLPYAALGEAEATQACIDQLQALGEAERLPAGTVAASVTRAYQSFVAERWADVIEHLEPIVPELVRIGGSRAQRDLVVNTLLAAYVNAGRLPDARAFLDADPERRPSRPIVGLG